MSSPAITNGAVTPSFQTAANAAADANGIPQNIFSALIYTISGWNTAQLSSNGAYGLTGVAPQNASGFNLFDPMQNIQAGAAYLKSLYTQTGSWNAALAAYDGEPGGDTAFANSVLARAQANVPAAPEGVGLGDSLLGWLTGKPVAPVAPTTPTTGLGDQALTSLGLPDTLMGVLQNSIGYIIAIFLMLVIGYFAIKALFNETLAPAPAGSAS